MIRMEIRSKIIAQTFTAIGAWRAPRVGNWWGAGTATADRLPGYGGYYNRRYPGNCRICTTALCNHRARNRYSRTQHGSPVGLSGDILYGGPFHVNVGNTFYTEIENSCVPAMNRHLKYWTAYSPKSPASSFSLYPYRR